MPGCKTTLCFLTFKTIGLWISFPQLIHLHAGWVTSINVSSPQLHLARQSLNAVYACHVVYDSDNFKEVKGEIITSRQDPSLVGLRNNSDFNWIAILPNGASKPYSNGQVIKLVRGLKINFGNGNEGKII